MRTFQSSNNDRKGTRGKHTFEVMLPLKRDVLLAEALVSEGRGVFISRGDVTAADVEFRGARLSECEGFLP